MQLNLSFGDGLNTYKEDGEERRREIAKDGEDCE